jgi:hypothetical protein
LRRNDYDTKPLEAEDFDNPGLGSLIFTETTKLWNILEFLSDSFVEQQGTATILISMGDALVDWINHLPPELCLYDRDGHRKLYSRPVSELFIQYFVTIILSQLPRHKQKEHLPPPSISSFVAASCAVELYDEINCRDDSMSLLPIHGFFCLSILLPLLCYQVKNLSTRAEARQQRMIKVLRSVLERMRGRYGDADIIIHKMDWLQKIRDRLPKRNEASNVTPTWGCESFLHCSLLFPFPGKMSDDLQLIELVREQDHSLSASNWMPTDQLYNISLDFGLMDFCNLTFDNLDSLYSLDSFCI